MAAPSDMDIGFELFFFGGFKLYHIVNNPLQMYCFDQKLEL